MGPADETRLHPRSEKNKDDQEETVFVPLGLVNQDVKPAFEDGRYTTVEGYLQLRVPIVRN